MVYSQNDDHYFITVSFYLYSKLSTSHYYYLSVSYSEHSLKFMITYKNMYNVYTYIKINESTRRMYVALFLCIHYPKSFQKP